MLKVNFTDRQMFVGKKTPTTLSCPAYQRDGYGVKAATDLYLSVFQENLNIFYYFDFPPTGKATPSVFTLLLDYLI